MEKEPQKPAYQFPLTPGRISRRQEKSEYVWPFREPTVQLWEPRRKFIGVCGEWSSKESRREVMCGL